MKALTKIWASCENCGLGWTQFKQLAKVWKPIQCPDCKNLTDNFDTENHNKGMKFKNIK